MVKSDRFRSPTDKERLDWFTEQHAGPNPSSVALPTTSATEKHDGEDYSCVHLIRCRPGQSLRDAMDSAMEDQRWVRSSV